MEIRQAYKCDEVTAAAKAGDSTKRAMNMLAELVGATTNPAAAKALRALSAEVSAVSIDRLVEIVRAAIAVSVKFGIRPDQVATAYKKAWAVS